MPEKTYGGKDVLGIEITENVNRNDGKPAFFNMGVHHAREWPAGELTMEWALELINGYKKGDARATNVVKNSRNIVVPIVNADGFEASRTAGEIAGQGGGRDESVDDTAYLVAGAATGGEYRRKNCRLPDDSEAGNCTTSVGLAENGVDPNRNYGGLWGGPGADTNPLTQSYRGPGPFSEPESRNVKAVVSRNQVMSLITNHTTAGLVLRAPGLASLGDPVDEDKGYKALGDAMAKENGYFSQKSFELYDTTGTTEDWSYNATGGFGFTFELYCGDSNYETGDCDDPAFHPTYQRVVEEWDGANPTADHANDPGPNKGYDGKGNREAYYIAAESALNEQRHSILEASVPPGTTLRLRKDFKTETFPQGPEGGPKEPIRFDDHLETTYDVGDDGKVRWHVNPSTRPIVAKSTGKENPGPPSPPGDAQRQPGRRRRRPGQRRRRARRRRQREQPAQLQRPPDHGPERRRQRVDGGQGRLGDADERLRRQALRGHQRRRPLAGLRARRRHEPERRDERGEGLGRAPRPAAGQEVRAAGEQLRGGGALHGDHHLRRPAAVQGRPRSRATRSPASAAARCSTPSRCRSTAARRRRSTSRRARPRSSAPARRTRSACARSAPPAAAAACASASGASPGGRCRSTSSRSRRGAGSSASGSRRASRRARKAVTWNGKGAKGDGLYFARYRMKTRSGKGTEIRRVTLLRRNGRFSRRPDFYRRTTCDLLPSYKLERAAFGGTRRTPLRIAYRVATAARTQVTVLRGKKVVKRFKARTSAPKRTHRLKLAAREPAARRLPGPHHRRPRQRPRGLHAGQPQALAERRGSARRR